MNMGDYIAKYHNYNQQKGDTTHSHYTTYILYNVVSPE